MFFVQLLVQTLFAYYIEVFQGTNVLPLTNVDSVLEISFGKKYWYTNKEWLYLVFFEKSTVDKNNIYVLILAILSEQEINNEDIFTEKLKSKNTLERLINLENHIIYHQFLFANIKTEENKYFTILSFNYLNFAIKLSEKKLYGYSTHTLKELDFGKSLLDNIKYGIQYYNKNVYFDGVFLMIESKIVYIVYKKNEIDKNKQSAECIVRRFFVNSRVVWAETNKNKLNLLLKRAPTTELDEIKFFKTEEKKDEFTAVVGQHKITLSFTFGGKVDAEPKIEIKGTEVFDTTTELKKLFVVGMIVEEIVLENSDVLHIAVPKFVFEEKLFVQQILFIMHYDISYKDTDSEKISCNSRFVFYPLNEDQFLFKLELSKNGMFFVLFKKVVENGCLFFRVEVQIKSLRIVTFELPSVPNQNRPELLHYVYYYLTLPLGKQFNGALVESEPRIEQNNNSLKSTESGKFVGRNKVVLLVLVSLFCLGVLSFVVGLWRRNWFEKQKKPRLNKTT